MAPRIPKISLNIIIIIIEISKSQSNSSALLKLINIALYSPPFTFSAHLIPAETSAHAAALHCPDQNQKLWISVVGVWAASCSSSADPLRHYSVQRCLLSAGTHSGQQRTQPGTLCCLVQCRNTTRQRATLVLRSREFLFPLSFGRRLWENCKYKQWI